MATASNATELRAAIQNASVLDPTITLSGSTTFASVTTLAKFACYTPLTRYNGYTINGAGISSSILTDTRIYQQNIDGSFAPGTVSNLTLDYSFANLNNNNTAIFAATKGTYVLDGLDITGYHKGWAGNGGVYMSMIAPTTATNTGWITTNFTLKNSSVNFASNNQVGNAAFMQSWNNNGNVTLDANTFEEIGYNKGTFHFASMYTGGATTPISTGLYAINDCSFNGDGFVKDRGNRLESVRATLKGNMFSQGSYLDLYGNMASVTIDSATTVNQFKTIANGYGIRVVQQGSSGAIQSGTPTFTGTTTFTGAGLPLKYESPSVAGSVAFTGTFNVVGTIFNNLIAGSQLADTISGTANADWINGDDGNDTITGGAGNDSMIGGAGNDAFVTGSTGDSTVATSVGSTINGSGSLGTFVFNNGVDIITGFQTSDKLDTVTSGSFNLITSGSTTAVPASTSNNVIYGTWDGSTRTFITRGSYTATNNDALFMVGDGSASLANSTGYTVLVDLTAALANSNFV